MRHAIYNTYLKHTYIIYIKYIAYIYIQHICIAYSYNQVPTLGIIRCRGGGNQAKKNVRTLKIERFNMEFLPGQWTNSADRREEQKHIYPVSPSLFCYQAEYEYVRTWNMEVDVVHSLHSLTTASQGRARYLLRVRVCCLCWCGDDD